jgi:hypothetical protein
MEKTLILAREDNGSVISGDGLNRGIDVSRQDAKMTGQDIEMRQHEHSASNFNL